MDVCPAKQWISFLLSLPFPGFPNPNSIPMSFAFWTLRKTLERHVQDPRRLRSKLKERQQTPFTSKLCESTVETHLSPLAGCPVESPGGIRLWVTSSVQDFQTLNVSWPFSPDVQSSPPVMLMDSKHDGQCLFYNSKSFFLVLLCFPYLQNISCLLNKSTKQTLNVC